MNANGALKTLSVITNGALKNIPSQTSDLLASLGKPEFCDIKIQANDGEIAASKLILSIRSEYFRAMFSNNCVESTSGLVKMPYPKAVLDKVIIYLYTGEMEFKDLRLGLLLDLLDLLRMMNLSEELKKVETYVVVNILKGLFPEADCVKNLDKSSQIKMEDICGTLLAHLRKRLGIICELEDVGVLSQTMVLNLLQEQRSSSAETISRFKIFVKWLSTNTMAADEKAKALEMFDFDHFTITDLASTVRESGLYSSDKIIARMKQISDEELEEKNKELKEMEEEKEEFEEKLKEMEEEKEEFEEKADDLEKEKSQLEKDLLVKDLEIQRLKKDKKSLEEALNRKRTSPSITGSVYPATIFERLPMP